MRRRQRGGRRQAHEARKAWIIGISAAVLLLGLASAGAYLHFTKRSTDRATGCPKDSYDSITVALVDLTDPVNPVQAAALRNALLKIRNGIPKYGRLEIYPLKPVTTSTIEPLFAGCSPGSGRDVDNAIYGNPELADRLWAKRFASKVDEVLRQLTQLPPQNNSPLLEGIQSVAVTAFGAPIAAHASEKKLILLSDMIHHTSDLSMYQGASDFKKFKTSQYYLRVKPILKDSDIDVFLIVRETRKSVQQPPLYQFWVEYAADAGGFLRDWNLLQ